MARPKEDLNKRFHSKTKKVGSCLLWLGGKNRQGYGLIWDDGKMVSAHRISFRIHKGKIPEGMNICHTCDIPQCVEPNHLWVGTTRENVQDKMLKGRFIPRGKNKK